MMFSKIFLIASLFLSSVGFGQQSKKEAQRNALYLFAIMRVAGDSARYGARGAMKAAHISSGLNVTMGRVLEVAKIAAGGDIWSHALKAAEDVVWLKSRGAARSAIVGIDLEQIGPVAAMASWTCVMEHENEIKTAVDNVLVDVQIEDVTLVNWDRVEDEYRNANLEGVIPIARQYYLEKVEEILRLLHNQ